MMNDLFENAPIHKAYFKLALPVVFSMVISLIYNMADTFFIAQTQNTQLVAGVSLCAPIFTLLIALGDIFGLGGSSVISRLFGQKNHEMGKRVSSFCIYGSLLTGLFVTVVMLLFKQPILTMLGALDDTMPYAQQYYTWMALGAPAVILAITPGNLIRTEGMAMSSMIGTVSGSVANIILDPIFIFGLNMGAGGAAIATVLGNLVTDAILLYFMAKKSSNLSIAFHHCRITKKDFISIFAIGIPASITNLMQSFCTMMINRSLIVYGASQVASMGIAMKINMIVMLIMVGFAFGAQPLLGYCYGSNNKERLKKIIRFDLAVELTFSVAASFLLALFAKPIMQTFMQDAAIIQNGSTMLVWLLVSMPFAGIILVFTTIFQAAGKAFPAFLLSISRQGVIFVICLYVLSELAGLSGIISAQAAADVLTALLAVTLYKTSGI